MNAGRCQRAYEYQEVAREDSSAMKFGGRIDGKEVIQWTINTT